MTESQARLVDGLCKIVATIGLVVGGGWTLYTYFNARAAEAQTAAIEARKPFLAKRLEVYGQVIELSAKLAYDHQMLVHMETTIQNIDKSAPKVKEYLPKVQPLKDEIDFDYRRLNELRGGLIVLVADDAVRQALFDFSHCLRVSVCPEDVSAPETAAEPEVVAAAENVAKTCKNSIGAEWQVNTAQYPIVKSTGAESTK